MKKILYGVLATIGGLVLLFSYRTSLGDTVTPSETTTGSDHTSGSAGQPSSPSAGSGAPTGSASAGAGSTTALRDGSYTGDVAQTRYGPVQVSITVSGGHVTAVDVPSYPDGNPRDTAINARAVPQLVSETLSAQSTQIDMVSGATYTSEGYLESLQSALDQAGA